MKTIVAILSLISISGVFLPAPAPAEPGETRPWRLWDHPPAPAAHPNGAPFVVTFVNRQHDEVKIYWLSPQGERIYYYVIPPGGSRRQNVRKDAVWIVTGALGEPFGYFAFEKPIAQAIIPHL